jgi:hypothetical protein
MSEREEDQQETKVVEIKEPAVKRDKRGRIISQKKQEASRRNWEKAVASRKAKKEKEEADEPKGVEYDVPSDSGSDSDDDAILNAIMGSEHVPKKKKEKPEKDYDNMSTKELEKLAERLERMEKNQVELAKYMKKTVKKGGKKIVLATPTQPQQPARQEPVKTRNQLAMEGIASALANSVWH